MAAPFIVLGGKAINHLADKHFDKIPDRALHIRDPKKTREKREEKERRKAKKREELGLSAGAGAGAGAGAAAADSDNSDRKHRSSRGKNHSEDEYDSEGDHSEEEEEDDPKYTFNDDTVDKYQYPDARNPSFHPGPNEEVPYRYADPRHNFPQAEYVNEPRQRHASYQQPQQQPLQPPPPVALPRQVAPYSNAAGYTMPQDRYNPPTWGDGGYYEDQNVAPYDDRDRDRDRDEDSDRSRDRSRKSRHRSHRSRPEMRSRSSHQGDRYYPSEMTSRRGNSPSTSLLYDGGSRRSHRVRSSSRDRASEMRQKAEQYFSTSEQGLAASAVGAIAGGVAGYKAAGGRSKHKDPIGPLLAGLVGAMALGAGANALEKGYEKKKNEKNGSRDGGSDRDRGAREGRTMTKWEDEGGNGFYEDRSRSRRDRGGWEDDEGDDRSGSDRRSRRGSRRDDYY